jgi:hypothetical protein
VTNLVSLVQVVNTAEMRDSPLQLETAMKDSSASNTPRVTFLMNFKNTDIMVHAQQERCVQLELLLQQTELLNTLAV